MANKKFLWVMLAGLLAFGLVFLGCDNGSDDDDDNGGGGGGNGPIASATWEKSGSDNTIELILRSPLDAEVQNGQTGFTVTVDGDGKTVTNAYCNGSRGKVYVLFGEDDLGSSVVVTISYDGTGSFADKLSAFTDMVVPHR